MNFFLLDNYDSFTYNLYDYLRRCGVNCNVMRNDACSVSDISSINPSAIVLSPGPKRPADAGIMMEVIDYFHDKIPILGICLGHQALGEYFGAELHKADLPMHGKTSLCSHDGSILFKSLDSPIEVMRYHSLLLKNLPNCITATAHTATGEVMALQHTQLPIYGVQFHPESILTPHGIDIIHNFVKSVNFNG